MGAEKIEKSEPEKKLEEKVAPMPLPQYEAKIVDMRASLSNHTDQKIAEVSKFKPSPEDKDRLKNESARNQLALAEAQSVTLTQVAAARQSIVDAVKGRLNIVFVPRPGLAADLGVLKLSGFITPEGKVGVGGGLSLRGQFGAIDVAGIDNVAGLDNKSGSGKKLIFKYTYSGERLMVSYQGIVDTSDMSSVKNTLNANIRLPKNISVMANVGLKVSTDKLAVEDGMASLGVNVGSVFANVGLGVASDNERKGLTLQNYSAALGVRFGPAFSSVMVTRNLVHDEKTPEFMPSVNLGVML